MVANAGCEAVRLSQVEERSKALEGAAEDLIKAVAEIEKRLVSVCRANDLQPEPGLNKSAPEECLVPLAENLRSTWRTVSSCVDRLRRLSVSVELPYS